MIWLTDAKHIKDYQIYVKFNNNIEATINLENYINEKPANSILGKLRDKDIFKTASFNQDLDTVVWSNGADIAPERLFSLATLK